MPPPLSKLDFAKVMRGMPAGASQEQLNTAANAASQGTPLQHIWEWANKPLIGGADSPVGAHQHGEEEGTFRRVGEDLASSLTAPASLASIVLGGAGAAAVKTGSTWAGVSKGARAANVLLQAPYVAEGAHNLYAGESTGEKLGGALEMGLGAWGMHGAATHSFNPKKVAQKYAKEAGLPELVTPTPDINPGRTMRVSDNFDAMPHAPQDPTVKAAYEGLGAEAEKQYDFLVNRAGVKIEPWAGEGEPYASSKHMVEDVNRNNHLWYRPTEGAFGQGGLPQDLENPMLAKGKNGLLKNDMFRAVHDYFGHAQHGFEFGVKGEEGAFQEHVQMIAMSPVFWDA